MESYRSWLSITHISNSVRLCLAELFMFFENMLLDYSVAHTVASLQGNFRQFSQRFRFDPKRPADPSERNSLPDRNLQFNRHHFIHSLFRPIFFRTQTLRSVRFFFWLGGFYFGPRPYNFYWPQQQLMARGFAGFHALYGLEAKGQPPGPDAP